MKREVRKVGAIGGQVAFACCVTCVTAVLDILKDFLSTGKHYEWKVAAAAYSDSFSGTTFANYPSPRGRVVEIQFSYNNV